MGLLVYTFGAFAFAALLAISVREDGRNDRNAKADPNIDRTARVGFALWTVCLLWFAFNLIIGLAELGPHRQIWAVQMAAMWLSFTFPPLIAHMTWADAVASRVEPPAPVWRYPVLPGYVLAAVLALTGTLGFFGAGGFATETVGRLMTAALVGLFIGASVYSMALLATDPSRDRTPRESRSSRWHIALFAVMAVLFVLVFRLEGDSAAASILGRLLEIAVKSLPIAFMFVGTYFEYRFEFFDLFIKRGLALVVTTTALVTSFALALPWLRAYEATWLAPWVYAIVLLPVAMSVPWLHARIGAMLDRRWLGRRYTSVSAVKHFLAGLRSATTDEQLVERAESRLEEIFGAPAAVVLDGHAAGRQPGFDVVQETPLGSPGRALGRVLLGERKSEAPYFSEDIALLGSLADVLSSVLENVRLQKREREQQRLTQELSLHASRSELRALRAQINPHFLFNALNAIAGLIHRDPEIADRTIEKLADVFRYTLRVSDREWALVDDEIEFVRAYLDVEQARFGERLSAEVRLHDSARGARVPTMTVQTLVENAIKHGAAAVRGQARIVVSAQRDGDRLRLTVEDNGPGVEAAEALRADDVRRTGYGLKNIRRRLEGHFGTAAAFSIGRDDTRRMTVAMVTLPFLSDEPRSTVAVSAGDVRP